MPSYRELRNNTRHGHRQFTTQRRKIRQKIAQLQEKLRRKEAAAKGRLRKDDTRRKIITGAIALEHLAQNPGLASALYPLLDKHVTRTADRQLLNAHLQAAGLTLLSDSPPSANDTTQTAAPDTATGNT